MQVHTKTLIALGGLILGVVVSENTIYGSEVAIFALALSIMQLVIYATERRYIKKTEVRGEQILNNEVSRFSIPLASGIFCMAVFVMILRVQLSIERDTFICEKSCTFIATIASTPTIKNEYQIFSVRPDIEGHVYDVQIKAPLYPRYEAGQRLTVTGKVSPPYVVMPHDGKKYFDYAAYLRVRSIGSEMLYPKIIIAAGTNEESTVTKLQHLREYFIENISHYVSAPASSLATGMLFGDDSMSKELTQTFRTAGISHIVVLSGFNIAILISFVLLVLMFVPLFLRIILAGIFVILFVLMVGGEASIIRATLMSFVGLLALMMGRGYVARQALLLSLIAIVLYEPVYLLHDVSLHLSFLATAGIVYMSEGIQKMLEKIKSKTYIEIITTTLAAYLATLPYVMYTFGTVSIYALLTNLIVLPFVPLMMLVTFFVVLMAPISQVLALLIGYVDALLGNFIIFIAHMVERLPFSALSVSFSFIMMCIAYAVLAIGYVFMKKWYENKKRDETILTNDNEILSGIISY